MSAPERDELSEMLADGWSIEGYANTMMAAGAMTFSVLLRKENRLVAVTAIQNGANEVGRVVKVLAPMPEKKKGWF